MNIFDTLKYKKIIKGEYFGFDFTADSEILMIDFVNVNLIKHGVIEHRINQFVNKYKINNMLIFGGGALHFRETNKSKEHEEIYRANIDGIPGFDRWDNIGVMSKFVTEIVKKNNIKYVIFTGNCASAWTSLAVAGNTIAHSVFLTTPNIDIGDFKEFNWGEREVHAYAERVYGVERYSYKQVSRDQFSTLIKLKDQGVKIDLHWSKTLDNKVINEKLSDIYERDRCRNINPKFNLTIHEHDMPLDIHPHNLNQHLIKSGKLNWLILDQIKQAKVYLQHAKGSYA